MASGDVKGIQENGSGTFDEVKLNDNGIFPKSVEIYVVKKLTAAEYAALTPKVSTTLYIIVG